MKQVHAWLLTVALFASAGAWSAENRPTPANLPQAEGFVDTGSAVIYLQDDRPRTTAPAAARRAGLDA